MKPTIAELSAALMRMHNRACGDESIVYMSVPPRPGDADLMLATALEELAAYRARDREALNNVRRHNGQSLVDVDL